MTQRMLTLTPVDAQTREIAQSLSMLQMARSRTLEAVQHLSQDLLDRPMEGHSIGSLLYHIALIELDWLCTEVREADYPEWATEWFPVNHRTEDGKLGQLRGEPLERHLERLARVRAELLQTFQAMDATDHLRPRVLPQYQVTPQWVLFHLLHHEALHFGQIQTLLRVMGSQIHPD